MGTTEVARLLGVSDVTVRHLVRRRVLPVYRFTRTLHFRLDEVFAAMDATRPRQRGRPQKNLWQFD